MGGSAKLWQAPLVGHPGHAAAQDTESLASQRAAAREQGYEEGYSEGLQAAQQQTAAVQAQLLAVADALHEPLQAVDERVVDHITELAIRIARRLVRRELRTSPSEIIAVVREALSVLPLGLSDIRLHLHPEDARLVGETLVEPEGKAAWTIVEDPVITRGGCRISSASSQVDATVETRLARVINSILGDDRDSDATND